LVDFTHLSIISRQIIHQRDQETNQGFRGFFSYIERTQLGGKREIRDFDNFKGVNRHATIQNVTVRI